MIDGGHVLGSVGGDDQRGSDISYRQEYESQMKQNLDKSQLRCKSGDCHRRKKQEDGYDVRLSAKQIKEVQIALVKIRIVVPTSPPAFSNLTSCNGVETRLSAAQMHPNDQKESMLSLSCIQRT